MNNISVTVLFYDSNDNDFGIRYSPNKMREKHVNLSVLSNDTTSQYLLVQDMSRLLNNYRSDHANKAYFCCLCLSAFQTVEKLEFHMKY